MSRNVSPPTAVALVVWSLAAVAQPPSQAPSKFFDSAGVRIHYNDQGNGAPVVLLHGYAMNVANTARTGLAERLVAAGYRVLAMDARGHGESAKPHDPSEYGAEMARDVVRLLDHLELVQAHVVGYSMGAIVSNKVRELYPHRLRSVVLGGAGWQKQGDYALADLAGSDIADALERTGSFEDMLRRFSAKQVPPPTNEEIRARNLRMVEGNDLKALAAVMRAWDGFAVPEANLRQNSVPTLAIVGALDPLKAKVDALVPVMRNLEVVVIPDADHGALSHPLFSARVIEFLERHPLESSASRSNVKDAQVILHLDEDGDHAAIPGSARDRTSGPAGAREYVPAVSLRKVRLQHSIVTHHLPLCFPKRSAISTARGPSGSPICSCLRRARGRAPSL